MRQPRLLVVVNNFPPDLGGGAAVFGDVCRGLVERGFDVTVRCAYPYYPEWRDKSGRNGWRIWRYNEHDVQIERYGLFIPTNPNSLVQRLLHELSFLFSLVRTLHTGHKFDMVIAYCPAFSCAVFGALNKLLWRKPLWLNVQDLAADAATASGLVSHRALSRLLLKLQAWFFNRADVWSTISPIMAVRLSGLRRRKQPLLLLPNWLPQSLSQHIERQRKQNPQRGCHQPIRLLYAGNIGRKQNLLQLLKALHSSTLEFDFAVHGAGAQAGEIASWIRSTNDQRFRFGPFLGEADFAAALAWTDFYVITETPDRSASFMPSKLIPGMAAGAVILSICDPDSPLGTEVRAADVGPWLPWDELQRIAKILGEAADNPQRYREWSQNALARSRFYDRETIIGRFAAGLSLISGRRLPATDY